MNETIKLVIIKPLKITGLLFLPREGVLWPGGGAGARGEARGSRVTFAGPVTHLRARKRYGPASRDISPLRREFHSFTRRVIYLFIIIGLTERSTKLP